MGALRKPQGRRGLNPVHHLDARTAHKYCVSLRAEELFCESVHIRHCGVAVSYTHLTLPTIYSV